MEYKIKPWAHQVEAIERAAMLPYFALFFEMGTGKTGTAINILRAKSNLAGQVLKTIIFCPPIVINNWKSEWLSHSNLKSTQIIPLVGSGKRRLDTFVKETAKGPRVFITNYQSLQMADLFREFLYWSPEALVFDESHRCKSHTAKTSKLAFHLANPFDEKTKRPVKRPLVYLLSGSPILNSPMDIYQQFKIMDGGEAFGRNYFAFRAKYFRDRNEAMPTGRYFPKWEVMTKEKDGVDALKEINEKLFSVGMRVEKKDCLDLPEEVSIIVPVAMNQDQSRLYSEMKNEFITFYNSKACVASLAITKALRLLQITAGFVSLENQEAASENPVVATQIKDTPKLETLSELLEEITEQGHKVLVWAVWKENYNQIRSVCEKLGLQSVEVHGGVSDKQKQLNVEKFKTDHNVKVFIGHPGSGGIGINLVNAAYSIFYSRTFSLEQYLQARARNHRGGSKEQGHEKITHYDLVCENTIDQLAVEKLANKVSMSEKLLNEISRELLVQNVG